MGVVTADQVLAFGLAAFILIVIPGPSVVFVIGRALAYGQGVALASVVGNSLGLFVVMGLVAFGLGAVVAESIVVFMVMKLAGAAYLVWLGVQALRHRREPARRGRCGAAPGQLVPRDAPGVRRRHQQPQGLHDLRGAAPAVRGAQPG